MGSVLSSAAVCSLVRATKNYARRWLIAQDAAVCSLVRATKNYVRRWFIAQDAAASDRLIAQDAAASDWSGLPEDLLLIVMAALDIGSLTRSGAVCTSWRDARSTFGIRKLNQPPCLLYACEQYGPSHAALYCPSTDATFRVPFPGPPHDKRGFVFSCNGLVFAADELGNPYLFNPITGVQATLPPVKTFRPENFWDDEGKHVYYEGKDNDKVIGGFFWARDTECTRVAISPAAELTACTVLIVHMPDWRLSYARPGDEQWTSLPDVWPRASDILYNDRDGLFYVLHPTGSLDTLDLNAPTPSLTRILRPVLKLCGHTPYLALTPSGELLQVWRMWHAVGFPLEYRTTYEVAVKDALQGRVDFVGQDDNQVLTDDPDIEVPQLVDDEDVEMEDMEVKTTELVVLKVDIKEEKLVELRDIGDNALFLGFNASICLPTKDFSGFESNCVYLTDDCEEYGQNLRSDRCIWNIKKRSMKKLDDEWANFHSCLALPAPIWITPRF